MDSTRHRVLALLRRYGWNATSFQVLEEGFLYAFDDEADACIAYVEIAGAWVVAGAPIAEPGSYGRVVERFLAKARESKRRVGFFAVEDQFLHALRLPFIRIGEQPTWDPGAWEATVQESKSLREQLRRARAKGVVVRSLEPNELADPGAPVRRAIELLIARWLGSRGMAPMGFLVDVQPFAFPEERRCFVAERDGRVVAFLAAVPVYVRNGWFFEDLLRDPSAPNGTSELVVDFAMRAFARQGSPYVTLGLAPLAGASGWLRVVRELSRALYDFEGVHAFKAKLRPHRWEPIYLAYPHGASANQALFDALAAFARGNFARYGAETLLRGPAVVVRALAAILVPWTVLLAVAPARWFPSAWLKLAWVVFDVAIAAGLFVLAARWRWWLGRALAAAITADAALTWGEAIAWNLPRARGVGDWIVAGIACTAPSVAAVILWGATGHRAWMRSDAPLVGQA
ncbi:MAG: phosphatidylglycerol lysyltransferase domain-containing protein [Polyangiaceae bacterium]